MPFTDEQLAKKIDAAEQQRSMRRTPGGQCQSSIQNPVMEGDDAQEAEMNEPSMSDEEEKKEPQIQLDQVDQSIEIKHLKEELKRKTNEIQKQSSELQNERKQREFAEQRLLNKEKGNVLPWPDMYDTGLDRRVTVENQANEESCTGRNPQDHLFLDQNDREISWQGLTPGDVQEGSGYLRQHSQQVDNDINGSREGNSEHQESKKSEASIGDVNPAHVNVVIEKKAVDVGNNQPYLINDLEQKKQAEVKIIIGDEKKEKQNDKGLDEGYDKRESKSMSCCAICCIVVLVLLFLAALTVLLAALSWHYDVQGIQSIVADQHALDFELYKPSENEYMDQSIDESVDQDPVDESEETEPVETDQNDEQLPIADIESKLDAFYDQIREISFLEVKQWPPNSELEQIGNDSGMERLDIIVDKASRDIVGVKMTLDDGSESPAHQVPYNTTNATETLTINVTETIESLSVAYDQRRNIQGLRLLGFNNTLMHQDYFAQQVNSI